MFNFNEMTKFSFSIESKNDKARVGKLITKHGEIKTPVLVPLNAQRIQSCISKRSRKT